MPNSNLSILTKPPVVVVDFDAEHFDCDCPVHVDHDTTPNEVIVNGSSDLIGKIAMPLIKSRPANVTEQQAYDIVTEDLEALIADVVSGHYEQLGQIAKRAPKGEREDVAMLAFNPCAVELLLANITATSAYDRMRFSIAQELLVISEMNARLLDASGAMDLTKIGASLIDGVERNRQNPETFEIPLAEDIDAIKVGDHVKIGLEGPDGGERFWIEVIEIAGEGAQRKYTGEVRNGLMCFPDIDFGQRLVVEPRHIICTR